MTSSGEDGEDEEEVTLEASREGYYPNLDPLPPGHHRYCKKGRFRIAATNAVRAAVCIECSPAVQKVSGSITN